MEPLLAILKNWSGLQDTEEILHGRGFDLPVHYRRIVRDAIGESEFHEIDRFWNEASREYVSSGGLANSLRREFNGETAYRSAYLDRLWQDAGGAIPSNGVPPYPGVREFYLALQKKDRTGTSFGSKLWQILEKEKLAEIDHFNLPLSHEWKSIKNDLDPHCREFGQMLSFEKKKGWWERRRRDGLIFRFKLISIGNRGLATLRQGRFAPHLPLECTISHSENPSKIFRVGYQSIAPCFRHYEHYQAPVSGLLGVWAGVNLLDAIDRTTPICS